MASQQVDAYSSATPATGDTLVGIDVSDTTDSANGTLKQFAFTNFQVRDATLTALAAFNTNGVLVQTAADTFVGRTLTGTSNRLTVTNGDGVSGAPTFDIDAAYVGQTSITTLGTIATGTWSATAIAVNKGGTNLTSYAVGDILYASGATTLAKLADIATGNVLISGGITTAPSWGKVDVTAHISGIVPSANGGTGVNNAGTITNASNTTITGGGTIALGGFTATIPATLTVAGLAIANTFTAAQIINLSSATALSVGPNGVTNPTLSIITNTASAVTGISVTGLASGNGATLTVISSATDEPLNLTAKGTGRLVITAGGGLNLIVSGTSRAAIGSAYFQIAQAYGFLWSTDPINVVGDTGFFRSSASVVDVTNGTSGQWGALRAGVRDTATNTITNGLTLGHQSSGTPAVGLGTAILFNINSTTTADQNAMQITSEWVVATHASRTARSKLQVYDTAAREALRIEASGTAAMIGFLGASAVVQQTAGANVTNNVTSGGTSDTIANYTDLTIYANDAAAIRNDIYQLARLVKQDHDALRLYGLLT